MKSLIIAMSLTVMGAMAQAEECTETQMCATASQLEELKSMRKILFISANNQFKDDATRALAKKSLARFDECYKRHMSLNRPRLAYMFCLNEDLVSVKIEHPLLELDPENPDVETEIVEYTN